MIKETEVEDQVRSIRSNQKYQLQLIMFKTVVVKILVKTATEPPYLKEFNGQIRSEMIQFLKKEFPSVVQMHRDMMDSIQHQVSIDQLLPQAFLILLTEDVDPIVEGIVEELQKKKDHPQALNKINFENLKLSKRLMNLIPSDTAQHQYIYELFLKWLLKIELNVDLIQRAYSYGMYTESVDSEFMKQMKEGKLPMTVIMRSNIHSFMGRAVDFIIEKCFAKSVDTLSNKLSSAVVSFVLCSIFGTAPIAIGGFVISFVDLPVSVNFNVGQFMLEPLVGQLKKYLNIGNKDVCRYILQEAISETDLANQELIKLINSAARRPMTSATLKPILNGIKVSVDDILKGKSKVSNVRSKDSIDRGPALAMKIDEEGFAEVCGFENAIQLKENSDDSFVEVDLKSGYELIDEDEDFSRVVDFDDIFPASSKDDSQGRLDAQKVTRRKSSAMETDQAISETKSNSQKDEISKESSDDKSNSEDARPKKPVLEPVKPPVIQPSTFKEDTQQTNPYISVAQTLPTKSGDRSLLPAHPGPKSLASNPYHHEPNANQTNKVKVADSFRPKETGIVSEQKDGKELKKEETLASRLPPGQFVKSVALGPQKLVCRLDSSDED